MEIYGATTKETAKTTTPTVQWDALNRYVVEECKLQQPETMLGVISVMVDLGTQKQNDAEYDLEPEDKQLTIEQLTEKYSLDIHEGKIRKFDKSFDSKTRSWVIRKFVPQQDRQSIVYAVDFPSIMLDKGKFFGEEEGKNVKPLRLWVGGQYWNKYQEKMLVQNVIPLKVKNIADDGQPKKWSMATNSSLYKMAVAAKIINQGDAFLPQDADKLLGKTLQFKTQVFFNRGKDGKDYYTEKLAFATGLTRDQAEKQVDSTYLIQFNQPNDPQALKELRKHIVNTIENATNYVNQETGELSAIAKQFAELRSGNQATTNETPEQPVAKQPKPTSVPQEDQDSIIPF